MQECPLWARDAASRPPRERRDKLLENGYIMRTILLQHGHGRAATELALTREHHGRIAAQLGMEYVVSIEPHVPHRNPCMEKIWLLNHYLELSEEHDLIIWLDADCIIVRPWDELPKMRHGIGMCRYSRDLNGWTTGTMLVRNTLQARQFIKDINEQGGGEFGHMVNEEGRIALLMRERPSRVEITQLDSRWNHWRATADDGQMEPYIVGFHNMNPHSRRLKAMQEAMEEVLCNH